MPEPHVRDLTPPMRAVLCDSGRHVAHPGETCEEFDELQAVFRAWFERALTDAYADAERALLFDSDATEAPRPAWLDGTMTDGVISELHRAVDATVYGSSLGEIRGALDWEQRTATPMERALAILDPHLRACPLYVPGPV